MSAGEDRPGIPHHGNQPSLSAVWSSRCSGDEVRDNHRLLGVFGHDNDSRSIECRLDLSPSRCVSHETLDHRRHRISDIGVQVITRPGHRPVLGLG